MVVVTTIPLIYLSGDFFTSQEPLTFTFDLLTYRGPDFQVPVMSFGETKGPPGQTEDFFAAVASDNIVLARALLNDELTPVHPSVTDLDGWTGLMRAVHDGHLPMCKALIERHARTNHAGPKGMTALNIACELGHEDITQLLLKSGADVNQADMSGFTPLMHAVRNKRTACARVLLASSAIDLTMADENGWTGLMWACESGHDVIVKDVIELGVDLSVKTGVRTEGEEGGSSYAGYGMA